MDWAQSAEVLAGVDRRGQGARLVAWVRCGWDVSRGVNGAWVGCGCGVVGDAIAARSRCGCGAIGDADEDGLATRSGCGCGVAGDGVGARRKREMGRGCASRSVVGGSRGVRSGLRRRCGVGRWWSRLLQLQQEVSGRLTNFLRKSVFEGVFLGSGQQFCVAGAPKITL